MNKYLELGWVIVGTSSSQHSEHGYSLSYYLRWSRKLGEPKHPEKLGWAGIFNTDEKEEPGKEV